MTSREIVSTVQEKFGAKITAALPDDKHPRFHCNAADWREIALFLRTEQSLQFDWLQNLAGIDYVADNKLCVEYDFYSFDLKHIIAVKVYCPRDNPHVPSVCDIWRAADWQEREAFDMYGIIFDGHPDLRRILCADDWVGYPLRKDYVFPREYHGIPGSVELDWQQQPDYPG